MQAVDKVSLSSIQMTKSRLVRRTARKIQSLFSYGYFLITGFPGFSSKNFEKELNRLLSGYPHNHSYKVIKNRLLPSFQLYERLNIVSRLYPGRLESLLDIGCCRGFFVLEAAQRAHCQTTVGVDIHQPFIAAAKKVKDHVNIEKAYFYIATLDELAAEPEAYGGPFQTVLLLGTYHYLFWGSDFSPKAYYDHGEILSRLSRLCKERLILSARLEVERLPGYPRKKAEAMRNQVIYNTSHFLERAGEFFEIRLAGYLGRYPLFLMSK